MAYDTVVKYRASAKDRERIQSAAKLLGVKPAKFMRDAVMNRVARIERQRARALDALMDDDINEEKSSEPG